MYLDEVRVEMKNLLRTIIFIHLFIPLCVIANNDSGNIKVQNQLLDESNLVYSNSQLNIDKNAKIRNPAVSFNSYIHSLRKNRNKNNNGFFVRDDFSLILVDLGVNLLDNNIKQRTHWGIRGQGIVGYGYKISNASSFLLGLNVPDQRLKNKNAGYISFSVGSRW